MSFDPNNVALEYLMQPELLGDSQIIEILTARCVRLVNMEYTRDQLLELFYRLVSPKEQRISTRDRRFSGGNNLRLSRNCEELLKENPETPAAMLKNTNSVKYAMTENCSNNEASRKQLKRSLGSEKTADGPIIKKGRQRICWP